jgi:hypothetical protein
MGISRQLLLRSSTVVIAMPKQRMVSRCYKWQRKMTGGEALVVKFDLAVATDRNAAPANSI